jgi:hypothetical protein
VESRQKVQQEKERQYRVWVTQRFVGKWGEVTGRTRLELDLSEDEQNITRYYEQR